MLKKFIKLCQLINCQISGEKTEWGTICIVFLGVLLDGEGHCLAIPEDKCNKALTQLCYMVEKKKVMVKEIQQLTGFLNFL